MSNDPTVFELFPELPPAAPTKKAPVRKQTAKVVVSQMGAPVPAAPQGQPAADDAESLARQLEANPDYRVLRRLKPRLQWSSSASADVVRVAVLDTETTGLDQSKDRIIELALLCVDVDRATGLPVGQVQVYDALEDPGIPISKEIEAITGITITMVKGQKLDDSKVVEILQGVEVVIAHNAGFDRPFVEARVPLFRALAWACSISDVDWKARGRSSAKLENLALANGLFYDAHRAEMDCHALLAVLSQPAVSGQPSAMSELLAKADKPSYRLSATNAPFDAKDLLKTRAYRWNADQRVWHTRLGDELALKAECEWLKANVYQQRAAVVQIEKMDARAKYSTRSGDVIHQQL